jgi:hypothetical protein
MRHSEHNSSFRPKDEEDLVTKRSAPTAPAVRGTSDSATVNGSGHRELETVSLLGEQGREVGRNLFRLSAGLVTIAELSPAYSILEDGALHTRVDAETAALLPWRQKSSAGS